MRSVDRGEVSQSDASPQGISREEMPQKERGEEIDQARSARLMRTVASTVEGGGLGWE